MNSELTAPRNRSRYRPLLAVLLVGGRVALVSDGRRTNARLDLLFERRLDQPSHPQQLPAPPTFSF